MDLIGSISYLENRFGGRKPNQGKGKAALKNPRSDAANARDGAADDHHIPTEYDTRLGRKLDTTA